MGRPTTSLEWATVSPPSGPSFNLAQAQAGHQPNTQLPAQWENDYKNRVYQWQQYLDSGADLLTNAVTNTLSNTSSDWQLLLSSAGSTAIVLPDETTIGTGRRFHIVVLGSSGTIVVKDSAGTTLVEIHSGDEVGGLLIEMVSLSNASATGHWAAYTSGPPGNLPGQILNVTAAAIGMVGEVQSSSGSQSLTGGTASNVPTGVQLTAGDWDISACLNFYSGSANTSYQGSISQNSGVLAGNLGYPDSSYQIQLSGDALGDTFPMVFPNYQVIVTSGSPTFYLVGKASNSCTVAGFIQARRTR